MPRPSIEYLNARRAQMPASGGKNYRRRERVQYAPECDSADIARDIIGAFSLWAETSRQMLVERLAIPQAETETDIPF